MQLVNEWFYYNKVISKKICNNIKKLGNGNFESGVIDLHQGITIEERKTGRKIDYGLDEKSRVSEVSWTNEQWVYDLIWPYMLGSNKNAGWNFDIKAAEAMQVTKYSSGGFYNWHRDGFSDCLSAYATPDNELSHGNVRKLSMTVLLNDNYEGGEFQFANYKGGKYEPTSPKVSKAGSVIVFPSFMEHRVSPVTKGIRYSLVVWFLGPPFK